MRWRDSHDLEPLEGWTLSCRIERLETEEGAVLLRVSGWIHGEHVGTLTELIGREKGVVAIDLAEVILVNRDAVRFLALSEAQGIELRNCPAYVREWVSRERTLSDRKLSDEKTGERDDTKDR